MDPRLPHGVIIRDLKPITDARGTLIELFRSDWDIAKPFAQWNMVVTEPNSLRGVHVHGDHDDYLIVISGVMHLGLYDLRTKSPTSGKSAIVELYGERQQAAFVPRGVMHGFYFPISSRYVYGLSACWSPADDTGCRWDDPELGIRWPASNPLLSPRDANAPSLADMRGMLAARKIEL
jgi:dTDP-4-dehydrorhamnose 3,5-epimerase